MNLIWCIRLFLNLFIFETVICTKRYYPASVIEAAEKKMTMKGPTYVELDNRKGCWPNNIIPYEIDTSFNAHQVKTIEKHISQVETKTCLRFVPYATMNNSKKYLDFHHKVENPYECKFFEYGPTHRIAATINLGDNCFPPDADSTIHEMFHALGFTHEHQRIDRDCYVKVSDDAAILNNQFKIIADDLSFETWPYDKKSIVHYGRSGVMQDRDEKFWGLLWRYKLGDYYGGFWPWEEDMRSGKLTSMDAYKINYRFCGAPDYCHVRPEACDKIEDNEFITGCKDLYLDIAYGQAVPTRQLHLYT